MVQSVIMASKDTFKEITDQRLAQAPVEDQCLIIRNYGDPSPQKFTNKLEALRYVDDTPEVVTDPDTPLRNILVLIRLANGRKFEGEVWTIEEAHMFIEIHFPG